MSTKQKIVNFILKNAANLPKNEIYTDAVKKFDVTRKYVSAVWCELESKGEVNAGLNLKPEYKPSKDEVTKLMKQEGDNLTISVKIDYEVKSLEDLLAACEVDGSKWEVIAWECKKWDLGIKNAEEKIETKQLFSVSARFKPKTADNNVQLQKEVILKELYEKSPVVKAFNVEENNDECLLELALFDVHFGKLAHHDECGDDYDLKIAVKRYRDAIEGLLSLIDTSIVDRILLPIGNDMINIDNLSSTTTAGTPQNCDSRFHKIVKTVKSLLIETINSLSLIAPVDVVVVAGNHDEQTSFMIGEILDAYYANNANVGVENSASPRKYYKYGTVSMMLTHGNREKHTELGMIFAAENPHLWASTTQRYVQLGHYHSNKKINYLSNQEFQGFQIQIMPSLSGADAWHTGKGYSSLKQAKAFLYNKIDGLVAELTHTSS